LKFYYGTGGDLNVDEVHEVISMTEEAGIWHPQEGVFNGHFKPNEASKINRIGQLRNGVVKVIENPNFSPDVNRKYKIADMITGYGVAEAVHHYYAIWGGHCQGKRVVIQGWGNVGAAAGFYLAQMGVKVVGIIDREGGIYRQEGYSLEEIRTLYLNRNGNQLSSPSMIPYDRINEEIWDLDFEIFIPAAASRLITKDQVDRMINTKLEVVSCGANVPFNDPEIFFGETGLYADENLSVIPDFIANCGMARVFAYLMQRGVALTDEAIFEDTSNVIRQALQHVYEISPAKTGISQRGLEYSLKQLV